jgi:glycosyltransferase involved in cell wall biosynthesis
MGISMEYADNVPIKILTNHWGQKASPTWRSVATYIQPRGNGLISSLILAIRLYSMRRNYDSVVLGSGRSDILFSLMQSILPFKKVPCVMIDCLWSKNPNVLRYKFNKMIFQIVNKSVDRFVVWAKHEKKAFAQTFCLPEEKFFFIPYHTTIEVYKDLVAVEGDYIFSGGNSDRDYSTLIEAVRGLPINVVIGTTLKDIYPIGSLPDNVIIKALTHEDYLSILAGCRINVVALSPGKLRSAGQQTFLNSMLLGKPTIVTDDKGPDGYIENGLDGIYIKPNDPVSLREAILFVLNNPDEAKEMGLKSKDKAIQYSTEEHFIKIVSLVNEIIANNK